VTNEEFTKAIAAAVGRPAVLKIPSFAARLAPGGMADEILLASTRVVPEKLLQAGYEFRFPDLRPALEAMLARDARAQGSS
jgi:NAD dependent epimerase/dehydratase family enzyme